jgi:replicative DNA helicase
MIAFENDRRTRAEQRVIASLMKDPAMIRHCTRVTPRDFSHELHGATYRAITSLRARGERVDVLSVFYEVTRSYSARFPGYQRGVIRGRSPVLGYLLTVCALHVVPAQVGYYAAVMLDADCNKPERAYVVVL